MKALISLFLVVVTCSSASAGYGSLRYAQRMQTNGRFTHDSQYRGSEVIFYSSGRATREQAIAAWMRSNAGHRQLLQQGRITEIQCHGNYCVGRGR